MSMDPITEKISHFIGSFEMLSEQARMREAYEEFRAMMSARAEAEMMELMSYGRKPDYDLEGYDAKIKLKLPFQASPSIPSNPETLMVPVSVLAPSIPVAEDQTFIAPVLPVIGTPTLSANFVIPIPSAVITVTLQTITLSDDDAFGVIDPQAFFDIAPITVFLKQLEALAQTLGVISFEGVALDMDWTEWTESIQANASQALEDADAQVQLAVFQGELPEGPIVNGELVDELPEWEDIIPAYHLAKLEEEEAKKAEQEETGEQPASHDFSRDFEDYEESPFAVDPGVEVVAGANKLINTTSIYSNWLDASVFVVGGDVLRFDAISQVNVLVDHDTASDGGEFVPVSTTPSKAINAAEIETLSVDEAEQKRLEEAAAAKEEEEEDQVVIDDDDTAESEAQSETVAAREEAPEPAPSGPPSNWAITHHVGDLVQLNKVKQYTFSTDMDQAVLTTSAAATFLGLGENSFLNGLNLQEIGFEYDLIFVSGDMIDVNVVEQTNVILDSDIVEGLDGSQGESGGLDTTMDHEVDDGVATVAAPTKMTADPSQQGQSSTPLQAAAVPVTETATQPEQQTVLVEEDPVEDDPSETGSEAIQQQIATQEITEAVEDNPDDLVIAAGHQAPQGIAVGQQEGGAAEHAPGQVAKSVAEEASSPEAEVASGDTENGPPAHSNAGGNGNGNGNGGVSQGDNLLFNKGQINRVGEDTDADLTENFAQALETLSDTEEDVSGDIVQDDLFDGVDLLRVLYIDGDFTTANLLQQTNILGDTDQVHVARDDFAAALQSQIEVTTGSNIAANFASITDQGLDSTVMAQGETYSDALIHQANLIDTPETSDLALGISALANEAVAFLAEGLIDPDLSDQIGDHANSIIAQAFQHADGTDAVLT